MSTPSARPIIVRIRNWVGDVVLGLPALRLIESHGYAPQIVARGKWAPALLAGEGWPVHVQPARLADKLAQLRSLRAECRLDMHRPALAGQQRRRPLAARDDLRRVAVRLDQPQRRQAQHHVADPVADADNDRKGAWGAHSGVVLRMCRTSCVVE